MNDYIVTHTFKSEEHRTKHFEATADLSLDDMRAHLKNENASLQINWGNPDEMVTYCWWKANTPADIVSTLGDMADLYHNEIKEMPLIANITD